MATLTEVAYVSRAAIKWGGIFLAVLIVGRVLGNGLISAWRAANPPRLPPPTQGFGLLQEIEFPESKATDLTYVLELPTGVMPQFGDRANIYAMATLTSSLIALERAKEDAKRLGFEAEPRALSDALYQWNKNQPLPTTLDMKIYTGAFTLRVDWYTSVDFLTERRFSTDRDTIGKVRSFLQRAQLHHTDLESGDARITYLKAMAQDFRETISQSEADFIQVDIFRAPIFEQWQTVTPDPDKGLVRAIMSGNRNVELVSMDYNYMPLLYDQFHSYWIKTPEQAYAELEAGYGYVARVRPEVSTVTVRNVDFAYFDSYQPQTYIQPVYVFTGDDRFVAYVPAVTMEARVR
jgi:hypothetical protein